MPAEPVLVITYLFPPIGGVGVPRFVAYARYLPDHNCEPIILTVRNPSSPVHDHALAKKVPPETKVYRAFNPEVSYALRDRIWKRLLAGHNHRAAPIAGARPGLLKSVVRNVIQRVFNPDVQRVWVPFAIRAARRIIPRHKVTTVILNLPPYSCLQIGLAVKRHFPGVKLILDFRDEWIENYLAEFDTSATDYKLPMALKLERAAVESADLVAAVTRAQLGQIRSRYPEQPDAKFIYAPNGFDPTDYEQYQSRPAAGPNMIVTSFGSVYANPSYMPLITYLDVVDELPEQVRSRIESRFIGRISREAEHFFEGRRHLIRKYGFMTREAAQPYLAETHYTVTGSTNLTSHGGRTFDMLAIGKPLLTLCPAGSELADLVNETGIGMCADPHDRVAIRQMLLSAFERFERGDHQWTPKRDAIRNYEWPALVARFVQITGLGKS